MCVESRRGSLLVCVIMCVLVFVCVSVCTSVYVCICVCAWHRGYPEASTGTELTDEYVFALFYLLVH